MVHDPKIKGSVQCHQHCHCLQMIHFPSWVGQATLIFDSRQKRQLGYSQLTFLALNDSQHQSKDKSKFHDGCLWLLGKNYVKSTEKCGKRRLMLSMIVSQPVYIYILLWSESSLFISRFRKPPWCIEAIYISSIFEEIGNKQNWLALWIFEWFKQWLIFCRSWKMDRRIEQNGYADAFLKRNNIT